MFMLKCYIRIVTGAVHIDYKYKYRTRFNNLAIYM